MNTCPICHGPMKPLFQMEYFCPKDCDRKSAAAANECVFAGHRWQWALLAIDETVPLWATHFWYALLDGFLGDLDYLSTRDLAPVLLDPDNDNLPKPGQPVKTVGTGDRLAVFRKLSASS